MSLINQMLRDLEQRRLAEAGPSPLGGLNASGSATPSMQFNINYTTLLVAVAVMFAGGVLVAYWLGSQQQGLATLSDTTQVSGSAGVTSAIVADNNLPVGTDSVAIEAVPAEPVVAASVEPTTESVAKPTVVEPVPADVVQATVVTETPITDVPPVETPPGRNTPASKKVSPPVGAPAEIIDITTTVAAIAEPVDAADVEPAEEMNKTVRPLTDEQQAQRAFQRSVKMLGRGNQQAAQLALDEALVFFPAHVRARETVAALLPNSGRVSEAASTLRDGLQLVPESTPLAKLYARILVDQGDQATAVVVLERALPAVSTDPEYYSLLAALYRQQKKHAQAAQVYQQILMQRPGVASWWMGLALSQDAMGEQVQARKAFQRALRAGGLSAAVLNYIQSRVAILTAASPVVVDTRTSAADVDEFGE